MLDIATVDRKLPPEFKKKWLEELRSGKYSQATGVLRDANGYCCLGVACKAVGINDNALIGNKIIPDSNIFDAIPQILRRFYYDDIRHTSPISSYSVAFEMPAGILATMNDEGKSFSEIADYIEENL